MKFWIVPEGHDTDSLLSLSLPLGHDHISLSGWFCPQNDSTLGGTIDWKYVGDFSASLRHDLRLKMIQSLMLANLYQGVDEGTADLMRLLTVLKTLTYFALVSITVLLISISLNLSPKSPFLFNQFMPFCQ